MGIATRQNEAHCIDLMAGQRQLYTDAKRAWFGRMVGSVGIAAAAPLIALVSDAGGRWLAAVAGVWIVLSRFGLRPYEIRAMQRAAAAQEEFDTYVFDLPWNSLQGARAEAQRLAAAARRHFDRDGDSRRRALTNWYSDPGGTKRPYDILICQRSNLDWSGRLHGEWTTAIVLGLVAWIGLGIVVAIVKQLSLPAYLLAVLAPSLPAFVDAGDTWELHRHHTNRRGSAELQARTAWADAMSGASTFSVDDCRHLQDMIWELRREPVWVPDWFYKRRKGAYERDMNSATEAMVAEAKRRGLHD